MPLFAISKKLRLRLEKLQRDFLLGGGTLEKKSHFGGRDILCMDRREEGVWGGCALEVFYLLIRLSWVCGVGDLLLKGEVLWKQVMDGKYGKEEGGWNSCEVRDGYEVRVWKALRKG